MARNGAARGNGRGLPARLAAVLADVAEVVTEDDGALTVGHAGTVASIRVVDIADGLQMVSLIQPVAWDLPATDENYRRVGEQAAATLVGTVALVRQSGADRQPSADVMLRYNFPAAGLSDDALQTLVLMVLAGGADVARALR